MEDNGKGRNWEGMGVGKGVGRGRGYWKGRGRRDRGLDKGRVEGQVGPGKRKDGEEKGRDCDGDFLGPDRRCYYGELRSRVT